MKKLLCVMLSIFILTGCGNMNNTPTKKVEELLGKYQKNDSDVISDLENVLFMDSNLTDNERSDYEEFYKKHYQDMTYKIKDEKIDGDSATVNAEITVRNYSSVVNDANDYRLNNKDKFDEDKTFASYRLDKLKDVTDTETYTITFHLTKVNDEWQVDPLSSDDESKLNGLYGVRDVNYDIRSNDTTNNSTKNNTTDNTNDNATKKDTNDMGNINDNIGTKDDEE